MEFSFHYKKGLSLENGIVCAHRMLEKAQVAQVELDEKILCSTTINQHVCSLLYFFKVGSTFLHEIKWVLKNCDKKVDLTLKSVRDYKYTDLKQDCIELDAFGGR
jgi:hypothetical protein